MGLLDNVFNPKLFSPDVQTSVIDNKKEMKVYAPQTSTQITKTSTSVFNPVDSRQFTVVINSSDVTTKKADKVSGSTSNPFISSDQEPKSSFTPDFGTSNPSTSQAQTDTNGSMSWIIIGAIAIGIIIVAKSLKGEKK